MSRPFSPGGSRVSFVVVLVLSAVHQTCPGDTLTVTKTGNSGPGSLRQAILDSNQSVGVFDTIAFNIPTPAKAVGGLEAVGKVLPGGVATISPNSAPPNISDPVLIDGNTQPGAAVNTNATGSINAQIKIELDGTNAGDANGLTITAGGSTVRGLAINRFARAGIRLESAGGNLIEGNLIGTDVTGMSVRQNGFSGLFVESPNNTIGGNTPAARNLSSGNVFHGVEISGGAATGNQVMGNIIGANAAGTASLSGPESFGVLIDGGGGNLIGGKTSGAGNVISGNVSHGIEVFGSSGNRIEGNFIGTDAAGLAALGNGARGVQLNDSCDNIIGGTEPGARNIISENTRSGIRLLNAGATGNQVQGNYIGTDLHGVADMGNGNEGIIINGGSGNTIGGVDAGSGNVISGNSGDGLSIIGGAGNAILMNSVFSNEGLGINLGESGGSPNDDGDGDGGPNNLQNFPVLDSAAAKGNGTVVTGSLSSLANTHFRIEFFTSAACDSSGHGEGRRFLGFSEVITGAMGVAIIHAILDEAAPVGEFLTATAIVIEGQNDFGDTSEFSECREVIAGGCIPPFPDFADNGRADSADALLVLRGILNGDEAFDLTCDGTMTGEDLIRFSLEWHRPEASKTR